MEGRKEILREGWIDGVDTRSGKGLAADVKKFYAGKIILHREAEGTHAAFPMPSTVPRSGR